MADLNERDAKLVQYLSEAYGKEKELEVSLEAHIAMATRDPYRKRLKAHLKETKAHAKGLERRIKKLASPSSIVRPMRIATMPQPVGRTKSASAIERMSAI